MKNDNNNDTTNKNLVAFKSAKQLEKEAADENVKEAIEGVKNTIESDEMSGIFLITFDKDGSPDIHYGGSLDPIKLLGAIELSKALVLETTTNPDNSYIITDDGEFDIE